jgi:arylsulfatase A-like enzyme
VVSTDRVTCIDAPVPEGGIHLAVSGSSSTFDGEGALVDVKHRGRVVGQLRFPEGPTSTQRVSLTGLARGRAELQLVFVNDEMNDTHDRNLTIEAIEVFAASPDAPAAREATIEGILHGASVVLISVDTLRADHLGSYGYRRQTSPHIDRLATQGTLFERASSTSTWTLPSHASLLTGLYPDEHGANSYRDLRRLPDDVPTLAAAFRASGYATGGFAGGRWLTPRFGFDHGFDAFENDTDWAASIEDYAHRGGSAAAWVASLPADQPYFLFVHYYQVHAPYRPPEVTRGRFLEADADGAHVEGPFQSGTPTSRDLAQQIARYDEDIAAVDIGIGVLLRELDAARPDAPPLVVLTADHGEEFFEHGGSGHGQPHREVLHVPLIVSHPQISGLVEPRVSAPVDSVRVAPTIAELVGLGSNAFRVERSVVPWMVGRPSPTAVAMAGSGRAEDGYRVMWRPQQNVVDWNGRVRVYDIAASAHEHDDLAADDPTLVDLRRRELDDAFSALAPVGTWTEVDLDETTAGHLRALGYLR